MYFPKKKWVVGFQKSPPNKALIPASQLALPVSHEGKLSQQSPLLKVRLVINPEKDYTFPKKKGTYDTYGTLNPTKNPV